MFLEISHRPATLLRKRLWHKCFPVNFAKFLRTPFLQNTSGRLLLRNEASGEDLKIFGSLTSLMHTIEAYLLPWLLLKYFISNNLACKSMLIPNLRVSTTVLNPVDIFVAGASWTLDCCKARLNHAIFLKG